MTSRALINIFGIGDIGKTETLKVLYRKIEQSPSFSQIDSANVNDNDFWAIVNYKGKKVGIITAGDPGDEIKQAVDDFLKKCLSHSCDRIFTVSRTRGEIFGMVINFANNNQYIFIETSPLHMRFPNGYTGNYHCFHDAFATMLDTLI